MLARLVVCLRCQQPQTLAGPVGNTMDCHSGHANLMTEAFLQTAGVFSQLELAVIRARVRSGMANASDNARMRQILQRTKTRKALVCKEKPAISMDCGFLVCGASGDTELFEKASNINGFQGGRVANNLYISPFWATVFQTAALFLYPNSSAVIWVENLRFLSLWLAF